MHTDQLPTLQELAHAGRYHWRRTVELCKEYPTATYKNLIVESIIFHNEQWNYINQLIRDGKYLKDNE